MCNNDDVDFGVRNTKYMYTLYASCGILGAHCWVITRVYGVRSHSLLSVLFQLSSNSFRCEKKGWNERHECLSYSRCVIYMWQKFIRSDYDDDDDTWRGGKCKRKWRKSEDWEITFRGETLFCKFSNDYDCRHNARQWICGWWRNKLFEIKSSNNSNYTDYHFYFFFLLSLSRHHSSWDVWILKSLIQMLTISNAFFRLFFSTFFPVFNHAYILA